MTASCFGLLWLFMWYKQKIGLKTVSFCHFKKCDDSTERTPTESLHQCFQAWQRHWNVCIETMECVHEVTRQVLWRWSYSLPVQDNIHMYIHFSHIQSSYIITILHIKLAALHSLSSVYFTFTDFMILSRNILLIKTGNF